MQGTENLFRSTSRNTLSDDVFNQFVEALSSGVYKAGDKLPTEAVLCESLKVSRPILRETIRSLCHMGYLTSVQGGGIYISEPTKSMATNIKLRLAFDPTQLMQVWELRYVIEVAVAGFAAERATDEEIKAILDSASEYDNNVLQNGDRDKTIQSTETFHSNIAKASHNDILCDVLESVHGLLQISRKVSIQVEGSSERAAKFHNNIANAIADRNPQRAKEEMRNHLMDVKKDLEEYMLQIQDEENT